VRAGLRTRTSPCTLAAGSSGASDWKYLSARRLALFIVACIERGTRWLADAANGPESWERAQSLVEAFLDSLDREGAFAGSERQDSYFVICDERVNRPSTIAEGRINVLFGFATSRPAEFHAWLTSHAATGCSSRPVAVNRLVTSQRRLEWEIETSILRAHNGGP
jgi:phage tail sheath protein FI